MRREIVYSTIRILSPTARMVTVMTPQSKRRTVPTVIGASLGVPSGLLPLIQVIFGIFDPAIIAVMRVCTPLRPFAPLATFDIG